MKKAKTYFGVPGINIDSLNKQLKENNKYIFIAAILLLIFFIAATTFPLNNLIFSKLFPKPFSLAALDNKIEAENGTLIGAVTVESDTTAAGGKYILFGGLKPTFTPTPTAAPPGSSPTPTSTPVSFLPAFPGAEGFGAIAWQNCNRSQAKVIEVTNLNDSGTGSLRSAISAAGPRIVVFKVGGTINVSSNISIENPCIYIAGQTAPGGGILIRGGELTVETSDVIVRHIRIRLGDMAADNDTVEILGASRVIFDHVSASWSIDETMSGADNKDVTVQWSIISEPLNDAGHIDGTHAFCSLFRGSSNITLHHNIYAHCVRRSPQGTNKGAYLPKVQVINNIMYNYIEHGTRIAEGDTGISGTGYYDIIRNRYIPKEANGPEIELVDTPDAKIYFQGNVGPRRPDDSYDEWSLVTNRTGIPRSQFEATTPFAPNNVTIHDVNTAYDLVLAQAGATLPKRDSVDQRIINNIINRTGQVINCVAPDGSIRCQKNAGGWPVIESGTGYIDSDHDGMPDDWERQYNLNPNNVADGSMDSDGDGYTNVEEFLNSTNPHQR